MLNYIRSSDSSLEHQSVPGVVECLKIVTRDRSYRIAKLAFDYATRNGRKKVTAVHKANIMKIGDGLFLKCCTEVAQLYPNIKFETMIVDNCTMQMVSNPHQVANQNNFNCIIVSWCLHLHHGFGTSHLWHICCSSTSW